MEKICIVRRRRENIQGVRASYSPDNEMRPNQRFGVVLPQAVKNDSGVHEKEGSEMVGDKNEMISFNLTSEQCELIRSDNFARYLSSGMTRDTALNIQQQEDGQISLNFYFDRVNTLRMLKPKHVCEMLQISGSFLRKLVKTKKLKSYKIGGLSRYSFEDILEFLSRNESLGNSVYKV